MRALVVHRNEGVLAELKKLVAVEVPCDGARTADEAIARLNNGSYSLVVLEHHPPDHDALHALQGTLAAAPDALLLILLDDTQVLRQLESRALSRVFPLLGSQGRAQLPALIATVARMARLELQQRELAMKVGTEHLRMQKRERLLDVVVQERTRELEIAVERLARANRQVLLVLAEAIEAKDPYTKGHCGRVAGYSMALAEAIGVPASDYEAYEYGSFLHDIGKIGVRDAVLLKPSALDGDEWKHMKSHPLVGDQIASQIDMLAPMRPAIRSHHERWDGMGYPDGLAGDAIPMIARVVCIADAFDAMVTERPYKAALGFEEAYGFLRKGSGKQFDPKLVDAWINNRLGQ